MKIRFLGHSCVEILGKNHIVIDPDFVRPPSKGVDYILVTHAHLDHIGRINELPSGKIIASKSVCEIVQKMGIEKKRLIPVSPGDQVENIKILRGFSKVNDPIYTFFYLVFRRKFPVPGGSPLSFLVQDVKSVLHIGDAFKTKLELNPDILCLPWRTVPFGPKSYKAVVAKMVKQFTPEFVLPIHHDIFPAQADPKEIPLAIGMKLLEGFNWHSFA